MYVNVKILVCDKRVNILSVQCTLDIVAFNN